MDKTSQFNELRRRVEQAIDLAKLADPKTGNIRQQMLTAADSGNAIQLMALIAQLDVPVVPEAEHLLDFLPRTDMPIPTGGAPGSVGDAVLTRLATGGIEHEWINEGDGWIDEIDGWIDGIDEDEATEPGPRARFWQNTGMFGFAGSLAMVVFIAATSALIGFLSTAFTNDTNTGLMVGTVTAIVQIHSVLFALFTKDPEEMQAQVDRGRQARGGMEHTGLSNSICGIALCAVLVIVVILLLYLLSCVWSTSCFRVQVYDGKLSAHAKT
jgi:hypothetical protein